MASSWNHARDEHETLRAAAEKDEVQAAPLWGAITSTSTPHVNTYPDAVRDTVPEEHAALLANDDVAAAWAFSKHWMRWGKIHPEAVARMHPFELRDVARGVWKEFVLKATQVEDLARGFGWDLSLAWRALKDMEASKINIAGVLAIAKLAGRMYAELRGGRARKVANIPTEVYSVEQGNDVARLLPAELAQACDPDLELPVLHRIATRRAAQYALRGTATAQRGPLVVALDESGSMEGGRNQWAKAAAIALARVAMDDKRAFSVVHFSVSTSVQHRIDPRDPAAIATMIRTFLDGGTKIALAIGVAVREVEQLAAKGDRGADVILVTDGVDEDRVGHTSALDAAAKADVRLWLVAIDEAIKDSSVLRARAAGYAYLGDRQLDDGASAKCFAGAV